MTDGLARALGNLVDAAVWLIRTLAWLAEHPDVGVPVAILALGARFLLIVGYRSARIASGWKMRRGGRRRITSFGRSWG
jgi:hypothetical protein